MYRRNEDLPSYGFRKKRKDKAKRKTREKVTRSRNGLKEISEKFESGDLENEE